MDVRPEVAQLAQRRGVEGAGLHPGGTEPAQPAAHLARRAGGERDRQHLGGLVDAGGDAVRDPVGDRPGLAGAGAGQHPDGPAQRLGDPALLGVERVEQGVGSVGFASQSSREQPRGRCRFNFMDPRATRP